MYRLTDGQRAAKLYSKWHSRSLAIYVSDLKLFNSLKISLILRELFYARARENASSLFYPFPFIVHNISMYMHKNVHLIVQDIKAQ